MATVEPITIPCDGEYELGLSTPKSSTTVDDTVIPDFIQEKTQEITALKSTKDKRFIRIVACVLFFVIATALVICSGFYFDFWNNSNANTNNSSDLRNYVLGNDTIEVTKDSNDIIKGSFTVGTEYEYEFVSISNGTYDFISFVTTAKRTFDGFTIEHSSASNMVFTFYDNGISESIALNNETATTDTAEFMEAHLGQSYAFHFVELSTKLGAIGYMGTKNNAVSDIHNFAKWIWKTSHKDDNIDVSEWPDLNDEFEKANAVVTASKNAGYWVTTMDELVKYTSSEETASKDDGSSRSLLSTCSLSNTCGNACYGRCGPDCTCWSWICGNCNCWPGCRDHDYYCSCDSMLNFWCINVFWVSCSG